MVRPCPSGGVSGLCIAATAWGTGGAVAAILYDTSRLGPVAVSWWRFAGGVLLLAAGRRCCSWSPNIVNLGLRRVL